MIKGIQIEKVNDLSHKNNYTNCALNYAVENNRANHIPSKIQKQ